MKKENIEKERNNAFIVRSIISAYNDMEVARKNYEFAEDELIDYYLYEIKANQAKLNYLIKKSKKDGIELDRIKKIKMVNLEQSQVV